MNSYTSCRVYLINKPRVGSLPSKISFGSFPFLKSGSLAAPRRPVTTRRPVKSVERGGQNGRYCFSLLEQSNGPFLYSDVVYSPQRQSRLFPLPPQQQQQQHYHYHQQQRQQPHSNSTTFSSGSASGNGLGDSSRHRSSFRHIYSRDSGNGIGDDVIGLGDSASRRGSSCSGSSCSRRGRDANGNGSKFASAIPLPAAIHLHRSNIALASSSLWPRCQRQRPRCWPRQCLFPLRLLSLSPRPRCRRRRRRRRRRCLWPRRFLFRRGSSHRGSFFSRCRGRDASGNGRDVGLGNASSRYDSSSSSSSSRRRGRSRRRCHWPRRQRRQRRPPQFLFPL